MKRIYKNMTPKQKRAFIVYNYEPFTTILIPRYEELLNSDLTEPNEFNELSELSEPEGQLGLKGHQLVRSNNDNN